MGNHSSVKWTLGVINHISAEQKISGLVNVLLEFSYTRHWAGCPCDAGVTDKGVSQSLSSPSPPFERRINCSAHLKSLCTGNCSPVLQTLAHNSLVSLSRALGAGAVQIKEGVHVRDTVKQWPRRHR